MARYQIRPLGVWGRPYTDPRRSAAVFKASWRNTVELLTDEVDKLGGDRIAIQVAAHPSDIRADGRDVYARAAVGFPGVKVSVQSQFGPLTYATDAYDQYYSSAELLTGWQANVRAVALGLRALRDLDRYGIAGTGEQYRGWTQLTTTSAAAGPLSVDEARRVLADAAGVDPASLSTAAAATQAFRAAARTAHPDAGGTAEVFQLIGRARDVLLAGAGQEAPMA